MAGYTSQRRTWDAVYPIRERLLPDYDALAAGETGEDTILVDLGGGAGHDLARFAATALPPTLTRPCLVLQDLPAVLASAPPLPPTITTTPIDFFLSAPVPGARAYYLHSILHDWPDDRARAILRTMRPALLHRTPSGRKPKLLLHENVLRGEGGQTQPAALDMIMLGAFAAGERSEGQWRALLEGAGYRVTGVWGKEGVDEGVVEAEAIEGWDEG